MALPAILVAGAAIISAAASAYSAVKGQPEQEQQLQQAGSLGSYAQTPQIQPFQQQGLPQQPNYQQPPAVTQFPQFQPLFPRRGIGQ